LFEAFKEERGGVTLRSRVEVGGVCRAAVRDAGEGVEGVKGVRGVEGNRVVIEQRGPVVVGLVSSKA
jgi:hypothetical protein